MSNEKEELEFARGKRLPRGEGGAAAEGAIFNFFFFSEQHPRDSYNLSPNTLRTTGTNPLQGSIPVYGIHPA